MHNKNKGDIGEGIAVKYLQSKGFFVLDRNYFKKWGELDIIAQKSGLLHFFEVKSVTYEHFTGPHQPEENVHGRKIQHIRRMIQTYYSEKYSRTDENGKNLGQTGEELVFQFHVLSIYMNMKTRRARIRWIQNIII